MSRLITVLAIIAWTFTTSTFQLPPPCPSEIYCYGPLLHAVQNAELYKDSKTFVDKKLRFNPETVLNSFSQFMTDTENQPTKEELQAFVDSNFEAEGLEFQNWDPSDWISDPPFLSQINNSEFRNWGNRLHEGWKSLGRQIKDDVRDNPDLYSIVYVPNPFIVPGGRFRESYYWDSYWIVKGLLISQMNQTVRGMLDNFVQMVDMFGLIPNGGRIYYQQRSQPPMLIPMVDLYVRATGDVDFLRERINLIEKEFEFWLLNRTVSVQGHTLARYNVEFDGPRPESYREDFRTAGNLSGKPLEEFYVNMKSGAESGWDFSTRWFIAEDGSNVGELDDVKITNIIPVDLNSFICMNAKLLSNMFSLLGDEEKSQFYLDKFIKWKEAIQMVLWNEEEGVWLDYDMLNSRSRNYFYASNISPLWAECWDPISPQNSSVINRVLDYLDRSQATKLVGGIPTSMESSGQQWDYPNGWAPLQHLMVYGLENSADPRAKALAFDIARKWLDNNFAAYIQSVPNSMFEKYDVTSIGLPGGGGEYDVQLGFGWTNGVVIDFLNNYGDRL
ncbi:trehalase-like [Daphnia pulicaria]|uniref:trehalase-like n=1 Tax=Daphnia pulicaria TaxID=35523 RepID=UPI001EEA5FC5|nr:trehalase-like [Daphnia pulicaria]